MPTSDNPFYLLLARLEEQSGEPEAEQLEELERLYHHHQQQQLDPDQATTPADDGEGWVQTKSSKTAPGKAAGVTGAKLPSSLVAAAAAIQQAGSKQTNPTKGPALHNTKPDLYKTALCQRYQLEGACKMGTKCWFAHGLEELRVVERPRPKATRTLGDMLPGELSALAGSGDGEEGEKDKVSPGVSPTPTEAAPGLPKSKGYLYKTQMCMFATHLGMCKRGATCTYAHDKSELRPQQTLPPAWSARGAGDAIPSPSPSPPPSSAPQSGATSPVPEAEEQEASDASDADSEPDTTDHSGSGSAEDGSLDTTSAQEEQQDLGSIQKEGTIEVKLTYCHFSETGECLNGEACPFAHGMGAAPPGLEAADTTTTNFPLYKTAMCRFMVDMGQCQLGASCQLAHSPSELRPLAPGANLPPTPTPSDEPEAMGPASERSALVSHATCLPTPSVSGSEEKEGEDGLEDEDSGEWEDLPAEASEARPGTTATTKPQSNTYKTRFCMQFEKKGKCWMGSKCHFAHTADELRTLGNSGKPNTYRTKLCRSVGKGEPCWFGSKCHDAHSVEQLRVLPQPVVVVMPKPAPVVPAVVVAAPAAPEEEWRPAPTLAPVHATPASTVTMANPGIPEHAGIPIPGPWAGGATPAAADGMNDPAPSVRPQGPPPGLSQPGATRAGWNDWKQGTCAGSSNHNNPYHHPLVQQALALVMAGRPTVSCCAGMQYQHPHPHHPHHAPPTSACGSCGQGAHGWAGGSCCICSCPASRAPCCAIGHGTTCSRAPCMMSAPVPVHHAMGCCGPYWPGSPPPVHAPVPHAHHGACGMPQ